MVRHSFVGAVLAGATAMSMLSWRVRIPFQCPVSFHSARMLLVDLPLVCCCQLNVADLVAALLVRDPVWSWTVKEVNLLFPYARRNVSTCQCSIVLLVGVYANPLRLQVHARERDTCLGKGF